MKPGTLGETAPATTGSLLYAGVEYLGAQPQLDSVALPLRHSLRRLPSSVLGVLRGNWLGHVLHPAATDWPHAAWLGASILDAFGGRGARPASRRLIGAGLLAAGVAIATGAADWSEDVGRPEDRRAGLLHGAVLTLATGMYAFSYSMRRRHRHGAGAVLALAGAAITTVGDYVGGYLTLGRGIGVAATSRHHEAKGAAGRDIQPLHNPLLAGARWAEGQEWLDRPGQYLRTGTARALPPGALKNVLTGAWLGHALHPLLTDFPIGAWTSASFLDLFGGRTSRPAAEKLAAFGLAAAIPTAAAGAAEWVDTELRSRRVGMVHAAVNATAWALSAASLACRRRYRLAVALRLSGGFVVTAGGYLGGHMSLSRGVGVSSAAQVRLPPQWTAAVPSSAVQESRMFTVVLGEQPVLVVADGSVVCALSATCTHRGGPLYQGVIAQGCVTCPWHGSRFRLSDGSVVRGPASVPAPAGEVRRRAGWVEVRRRIARRHDSVDRFSETEGFEVR